MNTLVLDIGSSSVRAVVFDEQLRTMGEASRPCQFVTTPPGASEIDADTLKQLAEACLDEIYPVAQNVGVVGITTFAGNLVAVDGQGRAITPVYSYADTRNFPDTDSLRQLTKPAETHQRTGVVQHTAYWPGRMAWVARTQPEIRVAKWLDLGAYLMWHWFGATAAASSYSLAAWNGMLNREKLTWDEEWIDLVDIDPNCLPPLADYDVVRQGLKSDYATRWPTLRDVPFTLAIGDGAAANIGVGAMGQNRVALTLGTTAALRIVIKPEDKIPPVPEGLWSYRVSAPYHLIGGATSEGGNIFQWARQTLNLESINIEAELIGREADGHGLTFLPLLNGERSPGWMAHATGGVVGLRLATTPLDILQAALEGVAIRLGLIAEQLKPLVGEQVEVMGGGGALTASPVWAQMICNALNLPLHLTAEKEVTARGMAILARAAIGVGGIEDFPPSITQTLLPQAEAVEKLADARARQTRLYNTHVTGDGV